MTVSENDAESMFLCRFSSKICGLTLLISRFFTLIVVSAIFQLVSILIWNVFGLHCWIPNNGVSNTLIDLCRMKQSETFILLAPRKVFALLLCSAGSVTAKQVWSTLCLCCPLSGVCLFVLSWSLSAIMYSLAVWSITSSWKVFTSLSACLGDIFELHLPVHPALRNHVVLYCVFITSVCLPAASKYSPPPPSPLKKLNTKSLLIRAFSSVWGCLQSERLYGPLGSASASSAAAARRPKHQASCGKRSFYWQPLMMLTVFLLLNGI